MSNIHKTAACLMISLIGIASISEAHTLRNRSFDFAGEFILPFDEIGEMLKDMPAPDQDTATVNEGETGAAPDVAPVAAPVAAAPADGLHSEATQPAASGAASPAESVEVLSTYNKMSVGHGSARQPSFELSQPMRITRLQAYHWNGGLGTEQPGHIGLVGIGSWPAEGHPGGGGVPNAEWIARPDVILPAGTYAVTTSAPDSWAHNPHSNDFGFVVVVATPVDAAHATPTRPTPKLGERQALEQLTPITRLKDWVQAVRANGNAVVYDLTEDPTKACAEASCNWCFRMYEDTPSHRTYFETYCVDAITGTVSAQID